MTKKKSQKTEWPTTNERKYNGGEWTEARFHGFVTSALRAASRRWPQKYECLADAFSGKKTNVHTGREAKHYKCAQCHNEFTTTNIQVDHKQPIINPRVGFEGWDVYIDRLYCEKDNLQILCKPCHAIKTKQERETAKQWKSPPATKAKKVK